MSLGLFLVSENLFLITMYFFVKFGKTVPKMNEIDMKRDENNFLYAGQSGKLEAALGSGLGHVNIDILTRRVRGASTNFTIGILH